MFDVFSGYTQNNLDYLILSDTEYDPLANSNLSMHFGLIFSMYYICMTFFMYSIC